MGEVDDTSAAPVTTPAEDGGTTLSCERLAGNDPVFKFLHRTLGGRRTVIVSVLLAVAVLFGGALLNGGLFNRNYAEDVADFSTARLLDAATSLRKILLISLGLSVYFLLPRWISNLFNSLKNDMVIADPRDGKYVYADFLKTTSAMINSKIWPALGVVTVVVFWVRRLRDYDGESRPFWLEVAALIMYTLAVYTILPTLTKLWLFVFSTDRLFRSFHIRVNPLHPDNAGGLGLVGRTLLNYVLIFAALGLLVAAGALSAYYRKGEDVFGRTETQWLLFGYASLPLLVWGWLWTPHQAMREARDRKLLILADEFLRATPDEGAAAPTAAAPVKESTERLSELKKQYELLRETYPTWPIRFRQVNRLVAFASAPLVTTALPVIIKYLGGVVTSQLKQ